MADESRKHFLIGTAGHVDHGKTALIKALTGIDTDRLEEERDRGISIVLGFASYEPSGDLDAQVGIIDVPGHERFIKTMVAGATGVDVALLVIACDEGVKPQTLEHLEILTLLGVENAVIALTKLDLVDDPEWVELVTEEIKDLVAPTFLNGAAIVPVSAKTGEGLDDLREEIERLLSSIPQRDTGKRFRMPIDRSFTIKGIGTVVTGSVWSGVARIGDPLQLQPIAIDTRIRDIQQHGESASETMPGTRTALALHSVSVDEAAPGTWLISPRTIDPTRTVDLRIQHLPSAPGPLKHNQRVRVHHGTMEVFGRLRILGASALAPGEEGLAQLHLEAPLVTEVGDRVLLRRYSPMRTIGGATIIDINPPRHRRSDSSAVEGLKLRAEGDPLDILASMVVNAGSKGVTVKEAANRTALTREQVIEQAPSRGWLVIDKSLVDGDVIVQAVQDVARLLEGAHEKYPLRRGLSQESIASELKVPVNSPVLDTILENAESETLVERDPPFWRQYGFKVVFEGSIGAAASAFIRAAEERDLTPWNREEAEAAAQKALGASGLKSETTEDLLEALLHARKIIRYPGGFFLARNGHEKLIGLVRDHFEQKAELAVTDFRDLTGGLTRKFSIPILEHLDSLGYTVRSGDVRIKGPALDQKND